MKTWASPFGLVIQPDALLVPRRPTFVIKQHEEYGWPHGSHLTVEAYETGTGILWEDPTSAPASGDRLRWGLYNRSTWPAQPGGGSCEAKMQLIPSSCSRWDLSRLSEDELASLLVAIDEQLSVGAGNPCPYWSRKIT